MRIPFLSIFIASPFEGLQEHAEKVKECAWTFQQAIECHIEKKCESFSKFVKEISMLESEADAIKRRIRGHLPKGTMLPVDKFQLFRYLREQDSILDAVEDAVDWISYRPDPGIPAEVAEDFILLADQAVAPIEELNIMVTEARNYFTSFSKKQRLIVKEIIHNIRQMEHDADTTEDMVKQKVFTSITDPIMVFHLIRLSETIGSIADHAENAGDMMRAMIAE